MFLDTQIQSSFVVVATTGKQTMYLYRQDELLALNNEEKKRNISEVITEAF